MFAHAMTRRSAAPAYFHPDRIAVAAVHLLVGKTDLPRSSAANHGGRLAR